MGYNEEITELLQEQKAIIAEIDEEVTSVKANKKKIFDASYIDPNILIDFERSESLHADQSGLDDLMNSLESDKLISCKQAIDKDLTYDALINLNSSILDSNNDKIYVIHITETRELFVERIEEKKEDDIKSIDPYGSDNDSDEDWVTEAVDSDVDDDDGALTQVKQGKTKKISIKSSFVSKIAYECQMSRVNSSTKSIQDLMANHRGKEQRNKWSVDENRLLSFFYSNKVYNEYDLSDKNNVQKLRYLLTKKQDQPSYIKLLAKFNEFIKSTDEMHLSPQKLSNNNIVNGVETTRNGVILQQEYIEQYLDNLHNQQYEIKEEESNQ